MKSEATMRNEGLSKQLGDWRYGHEAKQLTRRHSRIGGRLDFCYDGEFPTLVDLCLRSVARSLTVSSFDLLQQKDAVVWGSREFVEQAARIAAELSPQTISDDTLLRIMTFCGDSLRALHAQGCLLVTDKCIKAASSLCPALRNVDLRCTRITEQGIVYMGKNLKNLEKIWLSGCELVTDFAVTRLLLSCNKLSDLRLGNCSKLTDNALAALVCQTSLQTLDLGGITKLSEEALVRVVRSNTSLTELNLRKCSLAGSNVVWNIGPRVTVRLQSARDDDDDEQHLSQTFESWEDIDEHGLRHQTFGLPALRACVFLL